MYTPPFFLHRARSKWFSQDSQEVHHPDTEKTQIYCISAKLLYHISSNYNLYSNTNTDNFFQYVY